jgi:phosphate:Na+ symporter
MVDSSGDVVPNVAREIAMAHTMFNIVNTIVLFPIINYFVKALDHFMPEQEAEKGLYLDDRLLNNPSIALGQVGKELTRLGNMVSKNFFESCQVIMTKDPKMLEEIANRENRIDEFQQGIIDFTVKLSNENMSEAENDQLAFFMKGSHDLERIGDHAMNISELSEMQLAQKIEFSEIANQELLTLINVTTDILKDMVSLLDGDELELCYKILDEEDEIDELTEKLKDDHISRLNEGICNPYAGIIFMDLLTNIERVGDHASNIAQGILSLKLHQGLISSEEYLASENM